MEPFTVTRDTTRKIRRFNVQGRTMEFKINQAPEDVDAVGWVRKAINSAILYVTQNLKPTDQVGINICSKGFAKGEGWLRFQEAGQINTADVWNVLSSIFQSNSMGLSTDTFCLGVTSVRLPTGKGGTHNMYSTFKEECLKRRGIVAINNTDNLCLPRAIVVGIANINKDPAYKAVRQDIREEQARRGRALVEETGIIIPEDGCGIPELHQFQRQLKDFKITVYQYGAKGRDVIFQGPEADKNINLIYCDGHYNVITSLTSAFCCSYYCESCHVPYNQKSKHRCGGSCQSCQQSPPCLLEQRNKCSDCLRTFRSHTCFENHKKAGPKGGQSICDEIHQCSQCLKTVRANREHLCGEIYCKNCRKHQPQNHFCYMQPDNRKPPETDFLFVFFDLETRQETVNHDGGLLHEPNLCVFKLCCEFCIDSTDEKCEKCGVRVRVSCSSVDNYLNHPPIEWFLNYILAMRRRYKHIVVVAHNLKGFDGPIILNHILTKTNLTPELIMQGTKIIQMKLGNLKFIDSLNYFPMALAKLPQAFGLSSTFKKGYFPHLFNTNANQDYVGPLPAIEYYSPNTMMGTDGDDNDERNIFLKWYNKHKDDVFDFKKELVEYCVSDVEILTEACLKFRKDLLDKTNVDPFMEACTIASTCNKVFRRNFLKPNTIGVIPKDGYRWRDNQSKIAIQWLLWEEYQQEIEINHAAKDRESIIGGLKVDGYCEETKQVFEFHGCWFHGCPICFKSNRDKPLHDDPALTLNLRFESTNEKIERLRVLGYKVVEMWECNFRQMMDKNRAISEYTVDHPLVSSTPLNPRDAFYGGRTGNCSTYYECKPGEKIRYIDICSLYPWVCKYGKFPIKHPKVYVGDECSKLKLTEIEGLIKCSILPPQNLYHPVLPVKMNKKLMFVLCRTCGENMNNSVCIHTVSERAISGTWVIREVIKALEMGYRILEMHEIWGYSIAQYDPFTKFGGLFTEMMDTFIKIKQEASGWPTNCVTDEEKNKYIEEFFKIEGIRLQFADIFSNAGLRALAKLMLNSFWGKLGQRENKPKTVIINKPEEFFALVANPAIFVNNVMPINENVLVVNYEIREEACEPLATVNVCLAAYTTTQARLKLYSYLEILGDRVLYYDTDSVIYISRDDEPEISTGSFLGDMTDELEAYGPGSFITRFVSGGPKNYGYEVYSTNSNSLKTIAKVKGIRINYETSKLINFDSIARSILENLEPIQIVSKNIRRDKTYQVLTREEIKIYRPNSTKRKFDGQTSLPYGHEKILKTLPKDNDYN